MKIRRFIPAVLALAFLASAALAQAPAASLTGFRGDFLKLQDGVEKEILGLAEAMPADKFAWRPTADVRSVSEVYMHIVNGNYFITSFTGAKMPDGFDKDMEKHVTDKAKVIEALKGSFAFLRTSIAATSDADLDKMVKFFGNDFSIRSVFMIVGNHEHEHLGQSIAYARMNGIVPPWTAERDKKMKEMSKDMDKKAAPAPSTK